MGLTLLHLTHFLIDLRLVLEGISLNYIKVAYFCTNLGKYSFFNRIVQDWNSLPQYVVSSNTYCYTFTNRLDQHYLHCQGFL